MDQHNTIIKMIDNINNLRPDDEKGDGICFGASVNVIYSLFAGNLDELNSAVAFVHATFKHLESNVEIQQKIKEHENDPRVMGLIAPIVFAQKSQNYKVPYLGMNHHLDDQANSVSEVMNFLAEGAPFTRNHSHFSFQNIKRWTQKYILKQPTYSHPIKNAGRLTYYLDKTKLHTLLNHLNQLKSRQEPIALLISTFNHATVLGYDPKQLKWFYSDINNQTFLEYAESLTAVVNLAVQSFMLHDGNSRAVRILPIVHRENHALRTYFTRLHDSELEALKKLDENAKLDFYLTSLFKGLPLAVSKLKSIGFIKDVIILDTTTLDPIFLNKKLFESLNQYNDISHYLARHGNEIIINTRHESGDTPFIRAICLGDKNKIDQFLKNPCTNIELPDVNNCYPLTHALLKGNWTLAEKILEKLKYQSKSIDAVVTKKGETPIHLAIKHRHYEMLSLLLEKGADPFIKTVDNRTALEVSVKEYAVDHFSLLLKHHPNLAHHRNHNGDTPLHFISEVDSIPLATTLIEAGANVNAINKELNTPLHYAANWDSQCYIQYLCENKANINATNQSLETPLIIATRAGFIVSVEALINNKADVNIADEKGNTPLHYAAIRGSDRAARALIKAGANVDAVNKDGLKPIDMAETAEKKALFRSRPPVTFMAPIIEQSNSVKNPALSQPTANGLGYRQQ